MNSGRERTPRGATQPAASRRVAEADRQFYRQTYTEARSLHNELTRLLDDFESVRDQQAPATSRPPCRNRTAGSDRQAVAEPRSRDNEITRILSRIASASDRLAELESRLPQPSHSGASQSSAPADTDGVRSLGDSRTCGAPSQSAEPKSWMGDGWIVPHDNDADTVADDNDPETLAIFLQQFGLRDGTTDASRSAAPAPKSMPRQATADDAESVGYWRALLAPP